MNNITLNKLIEEKNLNNIFSLIATPQKNDFISWNNILEDFNSFLPYKKIDKKHFWGKDLDILYQFGFDIDFEDSFGNTLLFHLFSSDNPDKYLSFNTKDILSKTHKIYHNNNINENILFLMARHLHLVAWDNTADFISGQNLIYFIEQHPHFDLQQFNTINRNLLNCCLLNNTFPDKLFDYLLNKNVSQNHIDNDGYSLLNMFPLLPLNDKISSYFIDLCKVNDIGHTNKYKENCITNFINCISFQGNDHQIKNHVKWLTFIFNHIISEDIIVNNKPEIISLLQQNTNKYHFSAKSIIPLQNKTVSFLNFKMLDDKFPAKTIHVKKIKI